jgi:ElaB/YqjD/DUF883 family membrane-anchored ribosome-binding protein
MGRPDLGNHDVAEELRAVVEKAEELLATVSEESGETVDELRKRVNETVRMAKHRLNDLESTARDAGGRAASAANEYVSSNPWTAVAFAAAVGVAAAAVLSRRT